MAPNSDFVLLFVFLFGSSCSLLYENDLCNNVNNCYQNQSELCYSAHKPLSCAHQLKNEGNNDSQCLVEWIDPTGCSIEAASLCDPDELPFVMNMYHYRTWVGNRCVVNLTFPNPSWESLKFQYRLREHGKTLCRKFSLLDKLLPLTDVLMWDCPMFTDNGDKILNFEFSLVTNEGRGGNFAFRVPQERRFYPNRTKLEDWQVFFYLHMNHFQNSSKLPVTFQLAPFMNLSYRVSLVKCLDEDYSCNQTSVLHSLDVGQTELNVTALGDAYHTKMKTVFLPTWSSPAVYAVTLQIVSSDCPENGCFISLSPTFEIKRNPVPIWIGVSFALIFMFSVAYAITLNCRTKKNRKMLLSLKHNSPSVLLIYLPENHLCLELVKMLAEFLKDKCYVKPCVIDTDVGSQNPNSWTSVHMNRADRLLFIVPGNLYGESITPIRDQWVYALRYLSGHHFMKHASKKVAVILLPFSADVPNEIANVQRFTLQDMSSLVTWIHNGSWWDKKLLWGPQIRSSSKDINAPSLGKLLQLTDQASQITICHNGTVNQVMHHEEDLSESHLNIDLDVCTNNIPDIDSHDGRSYEIVLSNSVCEAGNEFDPNIPDVNDLLLDETRSEKTCDSDQSSVCSLDDSYFM